MSYEYKHLHYSQPFPIYKKDGDKSGKIGELLISELNDGWEIVCVEDIEEELYYENNYTSSDIISKYKLFILRRPKV